MTRLHIKDLRLAIEGLDDEMPVVLGSHCCMPSAATVRVANHEFYATGDPEWTEDHQPNGSFHTEPALIIEGYFS